MKNIDLDAALQDEEESKISVEASSQAMAPVSSQDERKTSISAPGVTSRVISPIPLNPAEMARMLALGKEKFAVYETISKDLIAEAGELIISDETSHKKCLELGLRSSKFQKEIDKKRKEFTKYADEFSDGLRDFVGRFIDDCKKVTKITKEKENNYLALKEFERRKQEKILKDAHAEVQKKVDEEAKVAGVETVKIPEPIVKQEEKTVTRTEYGSAYSKSIKDFKILNLSLVPREYLERAIASDPYKFLKAIINEEIKKNPEIEIPGVIIFDSVDTRYRTA